MSTLILINIQNRFRMVGLVMNLDDLETDEIIPIHNSLNPIIWQDGRLNSSIREHLLTIAYDYEKYLDLDLNVMDIVLTGSLANYNYTKFSDLDVHIMVNEPASTLLDKVLKASKALWSKTHNITIKGYPVEVYVEVGHTGISTGVYSLLKDEWIIRPVHKSIDISDTTIIKKAAGIIDSIEQINDIDDVKRIKDKINRMRRAGLLTNGEYSIENLTFKVLRNLGYIDKLKNLEVEMLDKSLTMEGE